MRRRNRGDQGAQSPEPPRELRELSEEQRARIEERIRDLRVTTRFGRSALKMIPWLKLVRIAAGYLEDAPALLAEITRLRGELAARGGMVE